MLSIAAGCTPAKTGPAAAPAPSPAATPTATPVAIHIVTRSSGDRYATMTQRINGRVVYELRAVSSVADRTGTSSAVATFEQPHITFHDRNGKTMIADAPEAKVTQQDKSVVMSGGVHARTQDGNVLTCDRLRYDGRTEKVRGEGRVVLTGPNGVSLTGARIDGDLRLNNVRITHGDQP
ncbi:MAG: hypothetical protein NVS2B17_22210 [Candidatus Velthaea sp.]